MFAIQSYYKGFLYDKTDIILAQNGWWITLHGAVGIKCKPIDSIFTE